MIEVSLSKPRSRALVALLVLSGIVLGGERITSLAASGQASATPRVRVAPSGNDSTCVRGDLAKPCATFRRAYEIAHCGDLVHVADGSYARQDLQGPDKSCSGGYVVFKGSRAAVVDEIKTAECCGRAVNGPDWIELNGFTLRNRLNGWGQADNWRVIGIDGGSFDINGPANWLLSGNDWGPCSSNTAPTCNGQNFAGGVSNLVIDGDTFHDFTITPGSGAHWECLFITGARGANVIRNSRFWNCETYGIYFSSFHSDHRYSTGSWTVENNWFGRTCCFGSSPRSSAINLGGSSPGEPVQNVLIRFNSFAPGQTLVREGGPTGSNLRAVGNIFGARSCTTDVAYSRNLYPAGRCSSEDRLGPPYGYRLVDDRLVFDGRRAQAVRRAFHLAALHREPPFAVARALRRARLPRPPGGWTAAGVSVLLGNRDYLGRSIGRQAAHPPLVSRREFNRAQRSLRSAR
ncbi:MAG: hypothetical protein KatS3mg012_0918 [Gaiellaceae bacterium]|nr:MAG: hypothetical protein KatS3mg012_0918 [Gaiellaceae bacterium]